MDIRQISTSPYSVLKEKRQVRVNDLLAKELRDFGIICSMSLQDKKELNSFYNDILGEIYNIRDNHPLKEIIS
ncbi:MAG TPA: hypothetical protein PL110_20695, partial [Candidatus Eremiobacteraeota bacterium]|nr:hypothetical protein [Candidatus Eremiobacteraeota bacterium]